MEGFINLLKALSEMGEEEETPRSSRTSSISNDSGFARSPSENSYSESGSSSFSSPFSSRSMSFYDMNESLSQRNSNALERPPGAIPPPVRNPRREDEELSGAEIAAGVAGVAVVALGAYGLGKWLFGSSNEPHQSRNRYDDDEEEVGRRRQSPKDYFNQRRMEQISNEIKK